jgi:hypothetical protein
MLFAISTDDAGRAILDDDLHGDVIAVIEAKTWQRARNVALKKDEMNLYNYKPGHGWFKEPPIESDNK